MLITRNGAPFSGAEAAKRGKILVGDARWRRSAFPSFEQPIKTVPPVPRKGWRRDREMFYILKWQKEL